MAIVWILILIVVLILIFLLIVHTQRQKKAESNGDSRLDRFYRLDRLDRLDGLETKLLTGPPFYGSDGSVTVYRSGGAVQEEVVPLIPPMTQAGMRLNLPRSSVQTLERFKATIHVHTGPRDYELQVWKFTLNYDPQVLRLISWTYTDLFPDASAEYQSNETGELIAIGSYISPDADRSLLVNNSYLLLVDLLFEVKDQSPTGFLNNVASLTANSMINQGAFEYVTDQSGEVVDMNSSIQQQGSLEVISLLPVKIVTPPGQRANCQTCPNLPIVKYSEPDSENILVAGICIPYPSTPVIYGLYRNYPSFSGGNSTSEITFYLNTGSSNNIKSWFLKVNLNIFNGRLTEISFEGIVWKYLRMEITPIRNSDVTLPEIKRDPDAELVTTINDPLANDYTYLSLTGFVLPDTPLGSMGEPDQVGLKMCKIVIEDVITPPGIANIYGYTPAINGKQINQSISSVLTPIIDIANPQYPLYIWHNSFVSDLEYNCHPYEYHNGIECVNISSCPNGDEIVPPTATSDRLCFSDFTGLTIDKTEFVDIGNGRTRVSITLNNPTNFITEELMRTIYLNKTITLRNMDSLEGETFPLDVINGEHLVTEVLTLLTINQIIPIIRIIVNYPLPSFSYSIPGSLARLTIGERGLCNFEEGEYTVSPLDTSCKTYPSTCATELCLDCLPEPITGIPTMPFGLTCIPNELSVYASTNYDPTYSGGNFQVTFYMNCGGYDINRIKFIVVWNVRNGTPGNVAPEVIYNTHNWNQTNIRLFPNVLYTQDLRRIPGPLPEIDITSSEINQPTSACVDPNNRVSCVVYPMTGYASMEIEVIKTTGSTIGFDCRTIGLCTINFRKNYNAPLPNSEIIHSAYVKNIVDSGNFDRTSQLRYRYERYIETTLENFESRTETKPRIPFVLDGVYPVFRADDYSVQ